MPNHIYGIVLIENPITPSKADVGVTGWSPSAIPRIAENNPSSKIQGPKPKSLSAFICGFKVSVTKRINAVRNKEGVTFWQRNYHEHIIRNEVELNKIRNYIIHNPLNWAFDEENPINWGKIFRNPAGLLRATSRSPLHH